MQRSKSHEGCAGCVYPAGDPAEFKARNHTAWLQNATFWLHGSMRHLTDLRESVVATLRRILDGLAKPEADSIVIDAGCGEGWALRALDEAQFAGRYVGLDFSAPFVDALRAAYAQRKDREFRLHDLEGPPPNDLAGRGDLLLNFFNLFELPQLAVAFENISRLLAPGGLLLILHIDPVTQLFAVSSSMRSFRHNLKLYEQYRSALGYDKDIDVGDQPSGRFYKGLAYSAADYFKCAKQEGLVCEALDEIVKTGSQVPQIYQMLQFRKLTG